MTKDIGVQFLCKDCENYGLCNYYHNRKKGSYICKYFHLPSKLDVLDKIRTDIQRLRGCSCRCSDGIIDEVEDIIDKAESEESK